MNLFVIAMLDEAKDIIKDKELIHKDPFILYKDNNNLIAISGIGKVNAAFVTSYMCGKYNIDNIYNLGFVGAIGNFKIGDKLLIKEARYHDFDLTLFGYDHGQVPNLPTIYKSDEKVISNFNYQSVAIFTGDYFMTEKKNDNYVVDMEVTSIFQVAHRLDIPVASFKIVSDIIGSNDHVNEYNEFEKIGSLKVLDFYNEIKGVI